MKNTGRIFGAKFTKKASEHPILAFISTLLKVDNLIYLGNMRLIITKVTFVPKKKPCLKA